MKLKKTWMGICVFVIYLVGILFAIGVTGFISGLFSGFGREISAVIIVAASVAAMFLVAFVGEKIGDVLRDKTDLLGSGEVPVWLEIVVPLLIMGLAASLYTTGVSGVPGVTGNLSIYEGAFVTTENVKFVGATYLENMYIVTLNSVMRFLGNELRTLVMAQLCMRVLTLLLIYISMRLAAGFFGAVTTGILIAATPLFSYSLAVISSSNLFYLFLTFDLMLVTILVRSMEKEGKVSALSAIAWVIIGAYTGYVVYLDLAAIPILVIALSAFFLLSAKDHMKVIVVDEILFILSGLIAFVTTSILLFGTSDIIGQFLRWANRFYGINSSEWFRIVNASFPDALFAVIMIGCAGIAGFGYVISARNERIIPILLFVVLSVVLSVVCGHTDANTTEYLMILISMLVGCGVSCIAYIKDGNKEDAKAKANIMAEKENKENNVDNDEMAAKIAAKIAAAKRPSIWEEETIESETPAKQEEPAEEEKPERQEEPAEEEKPEQQEETANKEMAEEQEEPVEKEMTEEQEEPVNDNKSEVQTDKEENQRFVPEGMVLPEGSGDEENLEPHFNMKRPEMEDIGILSINRDVNKDEETTKDVVAESEKVTAELEEATSEEPIEEAAAEEKPKDDFDIAIKPGDDFDI